MYKLLFVLFTITCVYFSAYAVEIETADGPKIITLQHVEDHRKQSFSSRKLGLENDYSKGVVDFAKSKGAVQLKPTVPILDQGQYGTCVTFATTAAMANALKLGDEIDQQCTLQLKSALGNPVWDGAYYSSEIIDPLKVWGTVRKGNCAGQVYPERFTQLSVNTYVSLVDSRLYQPIQSIKYKYYSDVKVEHARDAIKAGHYLTIGFLLLDNGTRESVQGLDMLKDGKKKVGGLWVCKQKSDPVNYCSAAKSGHEVIVLGYDDKQKLFKIQNSWTDKTGDSGFYYMSYDFFDVMGMDGTEIWSQ